MPPCCIDDGDPGAIIDRVGCIQGLTDEGSRFQVRSGSPDRSMRGEVLPAWREPVIANGWPMAIAPPSTFGKPESIPGLR